jgi:hypothetical protein
VFEVVKQERFDINPQNADSSFRGAAKAANPESIVTVRGHGFRLSLLRGSAGMTNSGRWYEAPYVFRASASRMRSGVKG